jgi:hypothetical protein
LCLREESPVLTNECHIEVISDGNPFTKMNLLLKRPDVHRRCAHTRHRVSTFHTHANILMDQNHLWLVGHIRFTKQEQGLFFSFFCTTSIKKENGKKSTPSAPATAIAAWDGSMGPTKTEGEISFHRSSFRFPSASGATPTPRLLRATP